LKRIINFALNNKLAIWILTILVVFTGLYSGLNMKQETIPNIELPNLSIMTTYPGAAPDVVNDEVTVPIEQRLQNLDAVEIILSSSLANASSIMIQFDYGTDMDKAMTNVQEALDGMTLPEMANDPDVMRISFDAMPIMAVSISDKNRSIEELTTVVEKDILPELEGIDGLADAQVSGQQTEQISLTFDEKALEKHGLDENTVEQLIKGSNVTFPLGLTTFDKEVKNVVIDGAVTTLDDLKNIQITYAPEMPAGMENPGSMGMEGMPGDFPDGAELGDPTATGMEGMSGVPDGAGMTEQSPGLPTVPLKDLAELKLVKEVESISRTNGQDSIGINFIKAPEANTVHVVNAIKDAMVKMEKENGITSVSTFDQGEPIEESIDMMLEKAIFGIIFAVIVILLFLRNFRTTLISIVSIPLSLLIAMFLLHQMDISLNILTLGALTVAIGRVIDDSIVVMENIYRRMSLPGEKLHGKTLVQEATRQMFIPIFSSTVVTVVVFLPIVLVGGMVGELFLPFAYAIIFALGASLLVAVTIVPMLAHTLFKKRLTEGATTHRQKEAHGKMAKAYKRILNWTLNHKIITFVTAIVLLVGSFFIVPIIGTDFLTMDDEKMIIATYSPDPGQTREQAEKDVFAADELIGKREGVEVYQFSLGGDNPMGAMMGAMNDNSAMFFLEYDKDFAHFKEEPAALIDALNENSEMGEWKSQDFASMSGGLEVLIYGDNLTDIETAAEEIMPILEERDDLQAVESSISENYDQYTLVVDQEKVSENGLTTAQIGMALNPMTDSNVFTTVEHDGKDVNVYLDVEKETYDTIEDLTKKKLTTALGTTIKIADVVEVKEGKSPETITRRDGKIYAQVSAEINSKDTGGVSRAVEDAISELDLPDGVTTSFGGVTEQMDDAFTQLGLAMLAAVAIVYFVLVVTFGGGLAPFAILFSLPFTIIGSLVALWIAREPLSVSSLIGALMLIGIVVTNAIVLIDRVIHNERDGLSTREALLEAGGTRLRPILMTALATIGALTPLLFGLEGGGMISKGLAVAVVGGLTSSTLLTLVIVPIVYETFSRFMKKRGEIA
jgi:HAE1 family hydrophobic/amphiphilic exporter-1